MIHPQFNDSENDSAESICKNAYKLQHVTEYSYSKLYAVGDMRLIPLLCGYFEIRDQTKLF